MKKWPRFNVEAKNSQIYSWYFLADLKNDKKRFNRIPSSDFPEMRPPESLLSVNTNALTIVNYLKVSTGQ